MKPFVSRDSDAPSGPRAENGASALSWAEVWGRFWGPWDIYEPMLTLAGLLLVANFLSLFQLPVLLEYLFGGVLLGGTVGKYVVGWHERGGEALSTGKVRDIERLWILIGVGAMTLAVVAQVALAHL